MTRSYGTFAHISGTATDDGRPRWLLSGLPPHVAQALKRILPRARSPHARTLLLPDTLEMARDLRWVFGKWPMAPHDGASLARLEARAHACETADATVERILEGHHADYGWREPARAPRPYQLQAAEIVLTTGRLLLTDEVGLGKTTSSLLVLRNPDALPALVVTLANLPAQWQREMQATLPWLRGHIITSKFPYDVATRMPDGGGDPDVVFISYHKLYTWCDHLAGQVRTVIFDEIQELRRGDAADKGVAAAIIAEQATYRMGLTATPIFNYGDEAHTIINILDPDALGSRAEFLREWGGEGKGKVADAKALGSYLRDARLVLRRTRAEVGRELPEAIRVEQPVETDHAILERLAGNAEAMARMVLDNTAHRDDRFHAAGELNTRVRHATGVAKAPYVAEFVRLLLQSERRVVLYGWHRDVYAIWLQALREYRPVLYTGSETPTQKEQNLQAFLSGASRVLMMSLRSGVGVDGLQNHCKVVVFGELDWTPAIHHQAIGRLHRDGQKEPVLAYFMVSDDGSDPPMAEILDIKRQQAEPIVDPDVELFEPTSEAGFNRIRTLATEFLRQRGATDITAGDTDPHTQPWSQPALVAAQ